MSRIRIEGTIFIHPYFWENKKIGSNPNKDCRIVEEFWNYACPFDLKGGSNLDRLSPFVKEVPPLKELGVEKVLILVAEEDWFRYRSWLYYKPRKVKKALSLSLSLSPINFEEARSSMGRRLGFSFFIALLYSITLITAIEVRPSTSFSSQSPPSSTTPPPPFSFFNVDSDNVNVNVNVKPSVSPFSSVIPILTEFGFHDLVMAAHSMSSPALAWPGPLTIFAPADSAVRTCPSCSLSLLLQEHSVPGLYSFDYLRKLVFGTKIETILPGRCLTVTSAVNGSKIFIGGAEITRPDLFNNGHVIVHGLQGFVSHLSPYSCSIDKMTSLSVPHPSPAFAAMRLMLTDVMVRLRTSGYSVLALALRVKYSELVTLHNMTVFAIDDASIFHGGHPYVRDVRFHIVPNRLLMLADLDKLPALTLLPTLETGESLVVTTASGGGVLAPLRINYVRIKIPDLIHNPKIVVHGLAVPFPHFHQSDSAAGGRSGFNPLETREVGSEILGNTGLNTVAPAPVVESTLEMEHHHGL
ncbi:hypothetical protein Ancab_027497 [Ancistrocladus abbreviatus]